MKKFVAVLSCCLLTFALVGCSGNSNTAKIPTGKDAVEKADGKGKMGAGSDVEASGMGASVSDPAI